MQSSSIGNRLPNRFFQSNRDYNRAFLQNSNRNRIRNPVKKSRLTITDDRKF